jgi:ABC-type transporter Mla subunit MlaD
MATKEDKDKKTAAKEDEKKKADDKASEAKADAKAEEKQKKANKAAEKEEATDEEINEGEELNELLALLEDGELTDLDPEEAIEYIDEWSEIMHGSKDESLKEISKNLKQLKKALTNSKAKAGDIAEVLSQLGEQTNEYADNAERGYKTKLHKLGKSLTKAAKALEQDEE